MAEKKKRGEYTLTDEEMTCAEMVFITLTMLESRGYPGFMELFSFLDDPDIIIKILRLFYGMTIKFPPLKEVERCLRAAEYAFCDIHKKVNDKLCVKPLDIRNHMNIDTEEEQKLLEIFDNWIKYMHDSGHDIRGLMHINRQNTLKRIDMVCKGKKWKAAKY